MNRIKDVVKVSIIGVLTNFVLVGFKAFVGFVSGSISIISDALNNLSDAVSSIVTIAGILLSGKRPDKKHPFGYGKIEHISSLVIGVIIIGTGVSTLVESVSKIITPVVAEFDAAMIVILVAGILVKLGLGLYTRASGKRLNSEALAASGTDALFDVLISTSTLVGALISLIFNVTIDGWLGLLISALVIKTGVETAISSFSRLIGERTDKELTDRLKRAIGRHKEVLGVYDLTLHHYGPEKIIGSVHIEVADKTTAQEIHLLTRKIEAEVFEKFGIVLTIGIYASNTDDTEYAKIKRFIAGVVKDFQSVLQMHGFYIDREKKLISCDLVFDFEEKDIDGKVLEISERIRAEYPKYQVNIVPDTDFSD